MFLSKRSFEDILCIKCRGVAMGYMLKDGFLPLEVPQEETIDIDTPDEYEFAFWKWEKQNEICD